MKVIDLSQTRSWVPGGHEGSLSQEVVSPGHGATAVVVHTSTVGPGGGSDPETHPNSEQIFVMLSGELTFLDAEENEYVAGPGTAVLIPMNEVHASKNRGSEKAVCLVITAPPIA